MRRAVRKRLDKYEPVEVSVCKPKFDPRVTRDVWNFLEKMRKAHEAAANSTLVFKTSAA